MSRRTGKIFSVAGRPIVDSRGVLTLAAAHEVVTMARGWSMPVANGAIRFTRVEARSELPGQEGGLYNIELRGKVSAEALRSVLLGTGLEHGGTFEAWPGTEAKACGSCGASCGCGPCRTRHGEAAREERKSDDTE